MAQYLLGPYRCDAVRFDPCGAHKMHLPDGVRGERLGGEDNWAYQGIEFFIQTVRGEMPIRAGDYIVTRDGQLDVCRGEFFDAAAQRISE